MRASAHRPFQPTGPPRRRSQSGHLDPPPRDTNRGAPGATVRRGSPDWVARSNQTCSRVNPQGVRIEHVGEWLRRGRQEEHDRQPQRLGCGSPRRPALAACGDRPGVAGQPAARREDVLVPHDHRGDHRRRGRWRARPNPRRTAARRWLRPESLDLHVRLHDVRRHLDGAAVTARHAGPGTDRARPVATPGQGRQAQGPAGGPLRPDHPDRRAARPRPCAGLRPRAGR